MHPPLILVAPQQPLGCHFFQIFRFFILPSSSFLVVDFVTLYPVDYFICSVVVSFTSVCLKIYLFQSFPPLSFPTVFVSFNPVVPLPYLAVSPPKLPYLSLQDPCPFPCPSLTCLPSPLPLVPPPPSHTCFTTLPCHSPPAPVPFPPVALPMSLPYLSSHLCTPPHLSPPNYPIPSMSLRHLYQHP